MPQERKPASERVRRNKEETHVMPAEGPSGKAPRWPIEYEQQMRESPHARAAWERLWGQPVAHFWHEHYHDSIVRLCLMYAVIANGDLLKEDKMLGRIRELEDALGLTPKAAHRMRWLLEAPSDEGAKKAARKQRSSARRDRLKVVGE